MGKQPQTCCGNEEHVSYRTNQSALTTDVMLGQMNESNLCSFTVLPVPASEREHLLHRCLKYSSGFHLPEVLRKSAGGVGALKTNWNSGHITCLRVTTGWQANKDTLPPTEEQRKEMRRRRRRRWGKRMSDGCGDREGKMSTRCIINSLAFLMVLSCRLPSLVSPTSPHFPSINYSLVPRLPLPPSPQAALSIFLSLKFLNPTHQTHKSSW